MAMQRMTSSDFDPEVLHWFDKYVHGQIDRRGFMNGVSKYAAVPFYGGQPAAEDVPKIKAALLIHYASDDERINAGWPAYEGALKAAQVKYEMYKYPGTQHGFNNDMTPRYDEAAAKLAWQRPIAFFNNNLSRS